MTRMMRKMPQPEMAIACQLPHAPQDEVRWCWDDAEWQRF